MDMTKAQQIAAELRHEAYQGGRPVRLTVGTGSMKYLMMPGDTITVIPAGRNVPGPGDIIVWRQPGRQRKLVAHRVVAVSGSGRSLQFWTAGDNNDRPDDIPIPAVMIMGKVQKVVKGAVTIDLSSRRGRFVAAVFVAATRLSKRFRAVCRRFHRQ